MPITQFSEDLAPGYRLSSGFSVTYGRFIFHPFKVAARVRIPLGVLWKSIPKSFIDKGFGMTASNQ